MTKTHTNDIIISLFGFCVAILTMSAAEVPPGKEVFRIVSIILVLVRVSTPDSRSTSVYEPSLESKQGHDDRRQICCTAV